VWTRSGRESKPPSGFRHPPGVDPALRPDSADVLIASRSARPRNVRHGFEELAGATVGVSREDAVTLNAVMQVDVETSGLGSDLLVTGSHR
jgi:hypothetical protein